MLRIAMVAPPCLPTPPPAYGGTELVVAELVDGLVERGHEVVLFAAPGSHGGFHSECEVVTPLQSAIWPPDDHHELLHARAAAAHIARDGGFDLVHAHVPAWARVVVPLDGPQVLTVHHERTPRYSEAYASRPELHYAFISARQRDLEVPLPRSSVVHHGLNPDRYPLGRGGRHAAFVGRFSACKGLHHAIDACARAGIALVAGGRPHPPDGPYADAELAHRLKQPHVHHAGEVDHARKLELLQRACALLFPIEWEEPFGLVMVESMLCGTPVIAFARGAAPEVVDEGVTGLLVDSPGELAGALRFIARHPVDREACRARALERFSASAMADRYLALYARALARAPEQEVSATHA